VNEFEADDAFRYSPDEVREALELKSDVPVLLCDARNPASAKEVLVTLVSYAHSVSLQARSTQTVSTTSTQGATP
jgi:signal recognition particle receptor subunit beta